MIHPHSSERTFRVTALVVGDALVSWGCLALVVLLRRNVNFTWTRGVLPPEKYQLDLLNVALVVGSLVLAQALSGFYSQRFSRRHRPIMLTALAVQTALVAIGATLFARPYPRTILLIVPIIEAVALPLWRRTVGALVPIRERDTVLVGGPDELADFLETLAEAHDQRISVIGLVGPVDPKADSIPYWGNIDDAEVQRQLREADEMIYVGHDGGPEIRLELLEMRGPQGYLLIPTQSDALLTSATFGWVGDQPLVAVAARSGYGLGGLTKRVTDIVLGTIFFIVALPIATLIALVIAIDDGFPILLRQVRAGQNGEPFGMWKFRTMYRRDETKDEHWLALDDDHRVTRVGLWLRRHRLDELPQLLNVLTGDMSLVGPRPERPEIMQIIETKVRHFDLRLLVRPGLAGLAQVSAEYDTAPAVKLRYDLAYICSWSVALDLRILFRAISTALSGRGV